MIEIWQLSIKDQDYKLAEGTERDIRLTIGLLLQEHGEDIFEELDVNAFFRYNDPTRHDQWRFTVEDVGTWYDSVPM